MILKGYYAQTETCVADKCNCVQRAVAIPSPCVGNGCAPSAQSQSYLQCKSLLSPVRL